MLEFEDRVKEITYTTGTTSTFILSGTVAGFQTFAAGITSGNSTFFAVTDGNNWEVNFGRIGSGPNPVAIRNVTFSSSNSGSPVNWSAGAKEIYCTWPAIAAMNFPQAFESFDDFEINSITTAVSSDTGFVAYLTGSGAAVNQVASGTNTSLEAQGVIGLSAGTSATSRCAIYKSQAGALGGLILVSGAYQQLVFRAGVDTLSTAAQAYRVDIGWHNSLNNAIEPTDGLFFKYVQTGTGDLWVAVARNNSTETAFVTNASVVAGKLYRLGIEVLESGNEARFYVDDVLKAVLTGNIPTTRTVAVGARIAKSVGATARLCYIDYYYLVRNRKYQR